MQNKSTPVKWTILKASLAVFGLCSFGTGIAAAGPMYVESVAAPISKVMPELQKALGQHHFKVVLHLDILKMIKAKQHMLHIPNLDKPGFSDVQSVVFCNPFFFNQLLNAHWESSAACPLTLTVYGRGEKSYIVYPKRVALTGNTPALNVAKKIDKAVVGALTSVPGAQPMR